MSDSYSDPQRNMRGNDGTREGGRGGFRGGRSPGGRDSGGFRIRLSENEMRAARSLQEAFNLRSTVAVLGFALRTLGQLLDEGKLEELVNSHRDQNPRGERSQGHQRTKYDSTKQDLERTPKPNPFERPAKPQAQQPEQENQSEEIENDINDSSDSLIKEEHDSQKNPGDLEAANPADSGNDKDESDTKPLQTPES